MMSQEKCNYLLSMSMQRKQTKIMMTTKIKGKREQGDITRQALSLFTNCQVEEMKNLNTLQTEIV